jgi:hypothetical protein
MTKINHSIFRNIFRQEIDLKDKDYQYYLMMTLISAVGLVAAVAMSSSVLAIALSSTAVLLWGSCFFLGKGWVRTLYNHYCEDLQSNQDDSFSFGQG